MSENELFDLSEWNSRLILSMLIYCRKNKIDFAFDNPLGNSFCFLTDYEDGIISETASRRLRNTVKMRKLCPKWVPTTINNS